MRRQNSTLHKQAYTRVTFDARYILKLKDFKAFDQRHTLPVSCAGNSCGTLCFVVRCQS